MSVRSVDFVEVKAMPHTRQEDEPFIPVQVVQRAFDHSQEPILIKF